MALLLLMKSVSITDSDFLQKLALLEIPRWAYSWDPAKVSEEEAVKRIAGFRADLIEEMSDPHENRGGHENGYVYLKKKAEAEKANPGHRDWSLGVLYGRGGWNRYRIDVDGGVTLLSHSVADKRYLDEARRLGFSVS